MNFIQKALFLTLLFQLSFGITYKTEQSFNCVKKSPQGFCLEWSGITKQTIPVYCFPENSLLKVLENGMELVKPMKDIKIGDFVLGNEGGAETYTKVLAWIHRNVEVQLPYLQVVTSKGNFMTSHFHNIAVKDRSYLFGKELVNEELYGNEIHVNSIEEIEQRGMYAPLTESGNYYILTSEEEKILAHNFANVRRPELHEPGMKYAIKLWDWVYGESKEEIHPVAEWLMTTFSFILEG